MAETANRHDTRLMAQPNRDDVSVPTSASFFSLPLELRKHIYGFCIPQNIIIEASFRRDGFSPPPTTSDDGPQTSDDGSQSIPKDVEYAPRYRTLLGLLLVCRQIASEVEPMFYEENSFEISLRLDDSWELRKFGPKQREMMRQVVLVMQLQYHWIRGPSNLVLDSEVWDGALGNLSRLGFVVDEQPDNYDVDTSAEWETALTTVLEVLGRTLPSATQLVIDSNALEETNHRVQAVLPGRCRFQDLPEGDFWFERGEYYDFDTDLEYDSEFASYDSEEEEEEEEEEGF